MYPLTARNSSASKGYGTTRIDDGQSSGAVRRGDMRMDRQDE